MSDQTANIFGETPPQNQGNSNLNVQNNQFEDLLNGIQNERGERKYSNVPSALEGLRNAQQFISQLKGESQSKEERIKQLEAQVAELNAVKESVEKLGLEKPNSVISPDQIAELVTQTLSKRETEQAQKSNIQKVTSTLVERFGNEAEKKFYGKAQELGLSVSDMNELAAKSPSMVLQLFGEVKQEKLPETQFGNKNTSAYQANPDTLITRNTTKLEIGATHSELRKELDNSRKMVEELNSKGMSTWDLTDPKVYFKYFGN